MSNAEWFIHRFGICRVIEGRNATKKLPQWRFSPHSVTFVPCIALAASTWINAIIKRFFGYGMTWLTRRTDGTKKKTTMRRGANSWDRCVTALRGVLLLSATVLLCVNVDGKHNVGGLKEFGLSQNYAEPLPDPYRFQWRGYYFEVRDDIWILGLKGGGSGVFVMALATVSKEGSKIKAHDVLRQGLAEQDARLQDVMFDEPVQLRAYQGYFFGQAHLSKGFHYLVDNINVSDVIRDNCLSEFTPETGENSWRFYEKGDAKNIEGKTAEEDIEGLKPDIGLIYNSTCFIFCYSARPTPTPTVTMTSTPSSSETRTPSQTPSSTRTATGTQTPSSSVTRTSTGTPSVTSTGTPSSSETPSVTPTTSLVPDQGAQMEFAGNAPFVGGISAGLFVILIIIGYLCLRKHKRNRKKKLKVYAEDREMADDDEDVKEVPDGNEHMLRSFGPGQGHVGRRFSV